MSRAYETDALVPDGGGFALTAGCRSRDGDRQSEAKTSGCREASENQGITPVIDQRQHRSRKSPRRRQAQQDNEQRDPKRKPEQDWHESG